MLSTTCWVITGASQIPVEGKVYLDRGDAQLALDTMTTQAEIEGNFRTPLQLAERVLVIAFGVTDQKVTSDNVRRFFVRVDP